MTGVLVVDDDSVTAELIRVVLEDAGHKVTVSVSADDAPRGAFACIVTDLVAVTAYTYEEAKDWLLRLSDRYPGVPVIVVTAHSQALRDADTLTARRVLGKPFDIDELVVAVREVTS